MVTDTNGLGSATMSSRNAGTNTITASSKQRRPLADSAAAGTFAQPATLNQMGTISTSFVWTDHVDASAIAAQFLYSQEGRSFLVNSVYPSILNRVADGPGLSNWTNALLNGSSDETIIASVLGSDEYFPSH